MKNTNSTEYKTALKAYLEPIIRDALTSRELPADGNIYKAIIEAAKSEVGYEFDQHGEHGGLTYWLQGLGMGIDFYNADIIRVCEQLHGCKLSAPLAEKVVENWFRHIASKIMQFAREA